MLNDQLLHLEQQHRELQDVRRIVNAQRLCWEAQFRAVPNGGDVSEELYEGLTGVGNLAEELNDRHEKIVRELAIIRTLLDHCEELMDQL
jgi:hypothetical protein